MVGKDTNLHTFFFLFACEGIRDKERMHDCYLSGDYKRFFSKVMGVEGLEPSTLRLSGVYSKPLSYMPL